MSVELPQKFDETQPQVNPWQKTPEQLTAELSEAKQFIRNLGLVAPGDVKAAAEKQAWELESKAKDKFDNRRKATKDFAEWEVVELELLNLKAREEAKRRYKIEQTSADLSLFDSINLAEALSRPEEPVQWRIKDLLMVGHITTVTAPAKAGKTVLQVNRVKSYVDGTPLFGRFGVGTPVTGNVGVWNFELNQNQMHDWFRKAGIVNRHKIHVINARGADLFIQNDVVLERAIQWIKDNDIEILEIDPLQAAFQGSVSSDEDAASYINALQRLQKESGVKDIILTTHMGHAGKVDANFERSIGSARWEGFADNMWIYKREGETSYLRIDKGRMEPVPEFGLSCDTATWKLNYLGDESGREAQKRNETFRNVVTSLHDGEPKLKTAEVIEKVAGTNAAKKKEVRSILAELEEWGILTEEMVKQESGQKASMVTMSATGCELFRRMIATTAQISRPTAEQIALLSQGG